MAPRAAGKRGSCGQSAGLAPEGTPPPGVKGTRRELSSRQQFLPGLVASAETECQVAKRSLLRRGSCRSQQAQRGPSGCRSLSSAVASAGSDRSEASRCRPPPRALLTGGAGGAWEPVVPPRPPRLPLPWGQEHGAPHTRPKQLRKRVPCSFPPAGRTAMLPAQGPAPSGGDGARGSHRPARCRSPREASGSALWAGCSSRLASGRRPTCHCVRAGPRPCHCRAGCGPCGRGSARSVGAPGAGVAGGPALAPAAMLRASGRVAAGLCLWRKRLRLTVISSLAKALFWVGRPSLPKDGCRGPGGVTSRRRGKTVGSGLSQSAAGRASGARGLAADGCCSAPCQPRSKASRSRPPSGAPPRPASSARPGTGRPSRPPGRPCGRRGA